MSATLNAAIDHQLTTRTKRNAEGKLLCRRCEKVVPPEYSLVCYDPSDETKVWGPCCSDECICHLKICSECNHDFVIDKPGEITHVGDGVWLCKECITKVEICTHCHRKGSLVDSPLGKMCKSCKDKKFFTCVDCNEMLVKGVSVLSSISGSEKAKWSHVINNDEPVLCVACYTKRKAGKEPLQVEVCKCCGRIFGVHGESNEYCTTCIEDGSVRKCNHCTQLTTRWDVLNGNIYCKTCSPKLVPCSFCKDEYFINTQGYKWRDKSRTHLLCSRCANSKLPFVECPSCLSLTVAHTTNKIKGKKDTCHHCHRTYNYCDRCGEFHFGEGSCREDRAQVCDYSYKPALYFNGGHCDRVFFGFENEINYTEENYGLARDTILQSYPSTLIYAKRDGSISGRGFEVVSQPMSYEFFKGLDLEPMFRIKPKERDTSCGLHVHVSRLSFEGQTHLFKLTEFINGNKAFIKSVAGRDFNSYAREYSDKISKAIKGSVHRERYHAVNLTNKSTIEIRIFKSARNEYQLRYRIEFVSALIEFTRNTSLKELGVDNFKSWLKSQSDYINLKKHLKLIKK